MGSKSIEQFVPFVEEARRCVARKCRLQMDDASDVVQQALVNLCRSQPDVVQNPRAYFHVVCARRAIELKRRRALVQFEPLEPDRLSALPVYAGSPVDAVSASWPRFSRRKRQILALVSQGMSLTEAAHWLNMKPGTVRLHLSRVRQKLMAAAA